MEDGWYILCPKCKTFSKGGDWKERYTNSMRGIVYIVEDRNKKVLLGVEYVDEEIIDTTRNVTWHKCGFVTEAWTVEDFAVRIENNKIVDWGEYWNHNIKELKKIVREQMWHIECDNSLCKPTGSYEIVY